MNQSSIGTSSGSVPRCLETIGDIIAQTRFENISKTSNDPLLARGNTLRSGEDSLKLKELMELCTDLQTRVLDLETTKTTKANEITSLKRRFKKLERRNKSRTHGLKRIYRVGLSRRVESSKDEVNVHTDEDMFCVNDLDGDEVIVDNEDVVKTVEETRSVVEEVIAVIEKAKLVSVAEETVNDVPQTTSDRGGGGGKGGGGGGSKSGGGGESKGDGGGGKCGGGSTRGGGGSSGKSGGGSGSMKASDSDVSSRKYYRYSGSLTILMLSQNVAWAIVNKCMTRSSTKELFTSFKDPEREFRSSRKHFKTLSLDESRSPDLDLFSDQEEYPEEEVAENNGRNYGTIHEKNSN
ncbi:retrovirus-related pol polyprotein from transposon TNT 1-94 [Tanacetum coccineum]